MDQQRKVRQREWWIIAVVLLVVCGWWLGPRALGAYKRYTYERRLKQTLQSIQLPPKTKTLSIRTILSEGDYVLVVGFYASDSDGKDIKAHYMQEFPRHGFIYRDAKDGPSSMRFCAPGYHASLSPTDMEVGPQLYSVSMSRNNTPC